MAFMRVTLYRKAKVVKSIAPQGYWANMRLLLALKTSPAHIVPLDVCPARTVE